MQCKIKLQKKKYLRELVMRRSEVHEKDMSRALTLNFDQ